MKKCIRAEDTVARQGGDEFLILIPNLTAPNQSSGIAKKLIAEIKKPFEIDGHEVRVGSIIGITTYPNDSDNVETLLRYGDIAMYKVKTT